jgi:secreted trypsin-like serine protease
VRSCPRASLALLSCLLVMSQGCSGCSPQPHESPGKPVAASPSDAGPKDAEDLLFGANAFLPMILYNHVEGEPDVHNRYPSVVHLSPQSLEPRPGLRHCAGVIVAPRLVLTAGHCFCWQRPVSTPEGSVEHRIEASSCVKAAHVATFFYEYAPSMPPDFIASLSIKRFEGQVRPHPQLEVRLDAKGGVLSSHADLALIVLDTPVPVGFRPVPLARTGARLQEALVRVGFAYSEESGMLSDIRLVHTSKLIAALDSQGERFQFERRTTPFSRGDSGGPCLRPSRRGSMLVGISTTGLGHEPMLTDLQGFRGWLQEEIQLSHHP